MSNFNPELGKSTSTNNDQLIDFIHHKEELIAVYNALSAERLDYNERKWETIRTGTYITLGLLAGITALCSSDNASDLLIGSLGLLLIIISPLIFYWEYYNVKRESELQYFVEFSIYQIEKIWTLHKKIDQGQQWLEGYPYIFDKKHRKFTFRSDLQENNSNSDLKNWVDGRVKKNIFLKVVFSISGISTLLSFSVGLILMIFSLCHLLCSVCY